MHLWQWLSVTFVSLNWVRSQYRRIWKGYNCIFFANDVANEKKVAVLLSVIGSKTYVLLRSLLHPEAPKEKTFDQLAKTLKEHLHGAKAANYCGAVPLSP